jgi:ATP-binding cassette subfamily B protein
VNRREGILDLLKPHWKLLALGVAVVFGEGLASLLGPWPLKVVIDNVLRQRPLHGRLTDVLVSVAGGGRLAILNFAAGSVLAIAGLGAACSYADKYITTSVGQWVMHDLRRTLYSHIQRLSLAYHDHKRAGDLISRVTGDIDAIQSFIASGLLGALVNGLTLVGMVGVMLYINWRFTLIALSVAPALVVVVYRYTRRIKKATRAVRKKEGEIVSVMQETFSSMRVVKAFAQEDHEQRRLEVESLESVEIALKARSLKARLAPLVEMIVAVGTCLVLWFGARMALAGTLSMGTLLVFILYLGKMYKPMQALAKMADTYSRAAVGYERIREILDATPEVRDLPRSKRAPRFRGRIEFDHVSFAYEPGQPVLRNVSFQIEPGQVAGLVGPTGSGKSTIASLVSRFYDPSSGAVKIDGRDIRCFEQKSLRQQISFVLQETLLFHGPIWQNIAYGKPDASRSQILRAAELANAHEFVVKMPEGYDTIVGERGVMLSGGQRQRIAIARAIIRDTPIVILDEPTTGLDAESEQLVLEALERLLEKRTAIVIAHQLSTIQDADAIFVIRDGVLVESGCHEELVRSGKLYAHLYRLQLAGTPAPRAA